MSTMRYDPRPGLSGRGYEDDGYFDDRDDSRRAHAIVRAERLRRLRRLWLVLIAGGGAAGALAAGLAPVFGAVLGDGAGPWTLAPAGLLLPIAALVYLARCAR